MEEMEEGTVEKADDCTEKEDKDWPLGDMLEIGCFFMQLHCIEG
jgi:hypothetical protein